MAGERDSDGALLARALAWRDAMHAATCDVFERWEHGTIVRSTRHPSYYDYNLVRVEDAEPISAAAVAAVADRALAGMGHRRVTFDFVTNAEPLRVELTADGWRSMRLLWMRHDGPAPPAVAAAQEVPYDDVEHLRVAWHHEESPGSDPAAFHRESREVALRRGAVILAVRDGGVPIGFAQLERDGDGAEISQVFVQGAHRGRGVGTALTSAAIHAARNARDIWIAADDEDRPKALYARLGFRTVWTTVEFQRVL